MIDFPEEFSQGITKETIIILDNASIHKSKIFANKTKEWEKIGLIIY